MKHEHLITLCKMHLVGLIVLYADWVCWESISRGSRIEG